MDKYGYRGRILTSEKNFNKTTTKQNKTKQSKIKLKPRTRGRD
jgi:hypothetical protein